MIRMSLLAGAVWLGSFLVGQTAPPVKTIYELTVKDIEGKEVSLSKYKGDVLLIVNVASL